MPRFVRRSLLAFGILALSSLFYWGAYHQAVPQGTTWSTYGTIWLFILGAALLISILEKSVLWGVVFGTAWMYGTFPAYYILKGIGLGDILSIGLGGPFLSFVFLGGAAALSGWVNSKLSQANRERLENASIERERARLKEEKNEIVNLVHQTQNIIEKAILDATNNGDSLWLSALLILQEDSHVLSQEFKNDRISYFDTKAKLVDLKEKAEVLSSPPPKEQTVGDIPGEPDYYQVLGIRRDASTEQIKDIYRKLAFIYHPDTGKSLGVDGDQRFRQIQEAYETLSDPIKRGEYDRKIGA